MIELKKKREKLIHTMMENIVKIVDQGKSVVGGFDSTLMPKRGIELGTF